MKEWATMLYEIRNEIIMTEGVLKKAIVPIDIGYYWGKYSLCSTKKS